MIARRIESLTGTLRNALNDETQPEEERRLMATHIRKEIRSLVGLTHQYSRDYLAAVDAAEGEKIGKTWSNRHKVRKPRDTIKCLKDTTSGEATDDPKQMADIAARYHESLQHQGHDPMAGA